MAYNNNCIPVQNVVNNFFQALKDYGGKDKWKGEKEM